MADDGNGGFAAFMAFVGDKAPAPEADQSAAEVDGYHYEEEQEREAMMKSYHHPMKLWYRQQSRLQVRVPTPSAATVCMRLSTE